MTSIEKLVAVLAGPGDDLEAALQQLRLYRSVDSAYGVQLDIIGKLVGQARQGLDDDTYRRYILARVATDSSTGKAEDLITISVLVLDDDTCTVQVITWPIASVVVTLAGASVTTVVANILYYFLVQAVAAGVRLYLVYSVVAPNITFTYDGTTAQAYDNGHYASTAP